MFTGHPKMSSINIITDNSEILNPNATENNKLQIENTENNNIFMLK